MRFAPSLDRLLHYQRGWLRADVIAGITVAAYLIPQVMAYGEVAGLSPVVGLWAILPPMLVYAVLGSSRQLSVGPESTTALMTATVVGGLASGAPARYAALAAGLALVVGVLALLAFVARLGVMSELLSKPVLVGYMSGVALIMIVGQLGKVTGLSIDGDTFVAELRSFASQLGDIDRPTLLLAAGVLTFMLVVQRLWPKAPVPLLAVLLATATVALFNLDANGIATVGQIPAGLPSFHLPGLTRSDLESLLLPALGVLIVGYSDNVLTARSFADRNDYRIDANQELLALGTSNVAVGLFQGFPVSSSGSRTAIGDSMRTKSQLYSIVAFLCVVLVLVFFSNVLSLFPTAALGAIVIFAALRLFDLPELRRFWQFRRSEFVLAVATVAGVLIFDILYGVLIAVGLSMIDMLRRVVRPHDAILGYAPGVAGMHDVDDYPQARQIPGLVVYRYDSPLFFANTDDFKRRALASIDAADTTTEWFLVNAEAIVQVDITSVDGLDDLRELLERRGISLRMARVKQDLRDALDAAGFVDRLGADHLYPTLPTAVAAYVEAYTQRHGHPPDGVSPPAPPTSPLTQGTQPPG
jgi:sulfate permease, SulP family